MSSSLVASGVSGLLRLSKSPRTGVGVPLLILLLTLAAPPGGAAGAAVAQVTSQSGGASFTWTNGFVLIQHPIPLPNAEPWSITTDPKGNVWFVEQGTNQLGEYDPSTGRFAQFPIPTSHSAPDAISSDRQGDIWFVELASDKLGELPAGGTNITEYSIPGDVVLPGTPAQTVPCGPGAVLADPSGPIWVACLYSNQIDEFNPVRSAFSSFDLPVFQSTPAGMVLDGNGNLWFAAAGSDMLGRAVISQLQNGTSDGVTESAPLNQTYDFKFSHPTSFLATTEVISSSLPTPSGIALAPSGVLWVTEHVDSSFDSYNPATTSLVKYWTAQTFGAYGFSASLPNGIAVGANGTVWIGEHFGNRIAEFIPSTGTMTEYPVPCCGSAIAGVYSVALAPDGRLWFVEIGGDAIGEVAPVGQHSALSLALPSSTFAIGNRGTVTVPLDFSLGSGAPTSLSLSVSGVTGTGSLQNMTAGFSTPTLTLAPGGRATSNLTLSLDGMDPGVYYLTLSATTRQGTIDSAILKVEVASGNIITYWPVVAAVAASAAVAAAAGLLLARRPPGGLRRNPSSRSPTGGGGTTPPLPEAVGS